tara:strand:- start:326 stop:1045 length:720 start_codon:yes stop_codon:yes gene_type:complete
MAINVDDVYQKVLSLANKEQRGYITPQEFNLYADHAQKEIFEQYFYELNQVLRAHGNSEEYSDIIDNLRDKISIFERIGGPINPPIFTSGVYRLGSVFVETQNQDPQLKYKGLEIQQVKQDELKKMQRSPLLKPRVSRPVCVQINNQCFVYPTSAESEYIEMVTYSYIIEPSKPNWGYVVVGGNAMYNSPASTNFSLHSSEENELVYRILTQAGVSIQRQDITQIGMAGHAMQSQQEKQ